MLIINIRHLASILPRYFLSFPASLLSLHVSRLGIYMRMEVEIQWADWGWLVILKREGQRPFGGPNKWTGQGERVTRIFVNIDYHSPNLRVGWYIKLRMYTHSSSYSLKLNLYILAVYRVWFIVITRQGITLTNSVLKSTRHSRSVLLSCNWHFE